ncbi:transcription repressor NadR [Anaeromicropila populeti]|uniref:Transcriptional regulator n=1 Tax=Anaeromicropila populeti TaxID=37658 RepID=A0A1I6LSL3_9FIRM|nr:transcription repressor NadR [Anaeromicropila populeti]SFS06408.1 hypothetical protein SAMN05661086_03539 [Anaeromicropila populeti]
MDGLERRNKLVNILKTQVEPINGTMLAKCLGVSRQVIVQDIALLRAENEQIISTTKGYMLLKQSLKASRVLQVKHAKNEIEDELNTIVDHGGKIKNVIVEHPVYGQIQTELEISSRKDVEEFLNKIYNDKIVPLKELTNGIHFHTIEAESENILNLIESMLREKNYLI